jgi:Bacterial surface proteins containing Ig-like domains
MITNKIVYRKLLTSLLVISLYGCNEIVVELPSTIELRKGYSVQLYSPSNNVEWGSSNTAVATVSSTGLVTAKGVGNATIYTQSSGSNQNIVCYLEVHPKRNILFYIGAGESLINGDAPEKINNIRSGWRPGEGEMLIYIDRISSGASLLRISDTLNNNGYYKLDTIQDYGVENSADPNTLKKVIAKMNVDYPADSYGMIFFSHGSGWLPEGTLNAPRSLVIDNGSTTNKEMEYADFAAAIPDKQFDFIIFEACLMADVLFMYDLRKKTDYVLASSAEIVQPGFADIYEAKIMNLYDVKTPVSSIITDFGQSYYDHIIQKHAESSSLRSVTMSLMKMDEMEKLAQATKAALKGKDVLESNVAKIDSIQSFDRRNTSTFGRQNRSRFFDFAHAMENLTSANDYNTFNEQMNRTVIWKASTKRFLLGNNINGQPDYSEYDGFFIKHHSGLTTYIKQSVYPDLNSKFKESSWYKAIR